MPRPRLGTRGPVMAMAVTQGTEQPDRFETKRYVYRGWGFDIMEEGNIPAPRKFIRPDDVPEPDVVRDWLIEEYRAERERQRQLQAKRERKAQARALRKHERSLRLVPPPAPEPEPSWFWVDPVSGNPVSEPSDTEAESEPEEFRVIRSYHGKPRPAVGWEPLRGDDLDNLLDELT